MISYFETVTNTRGDSLAEYRVQVVDSAGAAVNIFADSSGTQFTDSAGNAVNYATAGTSGKAQFWWTPASGQVLQVLDASGELVDATPDFADKYVIGNLPGEIAQSAVTGLVADLSAKAATADLASTDAGKGAALIGWVRDATGAVARTLADLFDDRPSVMDFIPLVERVKIRLGTSTADVRGYLQAAIDAVEDRGGGDLLVPTGTYRVVITDSVTDRGLIIKDDVALLAKGATINLECTGACYGIRLKNRSAIIGGTVAVTSSTSPGSQSIWHSCISMGDAYGFGGTPGAVSSFQNVSGWRIQDVTLTNARASGAGGCSAITGYGDISHGVIDGITVPDSATLYGAVQFDWAYVGADGTINSGDIAASRTNFNNGDAYTTHPHDISVRSVKVGSLSTSGSIPIRLAGVHNITIDGVEIAGSQVAGVYHHAGDLGYEFALAAVKPFRHKGIVIRNVTVKDANNGWGLWIDCRADNIANAISGSGYSALLSPIQSMGAIAENVKTYSDGGASVIAGVRVQQVIDVTLSGILATGHKQGILVEEGADEIKVVGGRVFSNREDGLYAAHPSDKPQNLLIDGLRSYQNNTSGGTFANIRVLNTDFATVRNCVIGRATDAASWGFRTDGTATNLTLIGNHVEASGVVGYSLGSSGDYGILRAFKNNTCDASVGTPIAGVEIINEDTVLGTDGVARRHCFAQRAALTGDVTPANGGAWVAGERIHYLAPVAGGAQGSICTTSGTAGTTAVFKTFGSVAA